MSNPRTRQVMLTVMNLMVLVAIVASLAAPQKWG